MDWGVPRLQSKNSNANKLMQMPSATESSKNRKKGYKLWKLSWFIPGRNLRKSMELVGWRI